MKIVSVTAVMLNITKEQHVIFQELVQAKKSYVKMAEL